MWKLSVQLKTRSYLSIIGASAWLLASPAFPGTSDLDQEIHLAGTSNTRDIAGYQADGLYTLRGGQILRSDKLSRLTASDFSKLEKIGVRTVIDLRTDKERKQSPTKWQGDNPPQFFHFPIGDANNDWFTAQRRLMKKNKFTEAQAREHMINGYRMIATEGPDSYRRMMALVLDQSNWPLLIHCTAGKDRTGVAITLLLEALGVDRESIMEEFLLTNEMSRAEKKAVFLSKQRKNSSNGRSFGKGPSASAWFPILGVKPEMLEAYYASIDEQYGSMDAFLSELGVDQGARSRFAASLTTEQPKLAMAE